MARVITFSRKFPAYHHRKGQPTYFVEKFWKSIMAGHDRSLIPYIQEYYSRINWYFGEHHPKHHTIRVGKRFKAGDYFSPRVWSGKPYNSKQIIIARDTLIVKTFDFELRGSEYLLNGKSLNLSQLKEVATNDGLEVDDLELWFQKPFIGQVICWNESVNY